MQIVARNLEQKLMWQGCQNPGTVTGILLATPGAAMIHAAQHLIRVEYNLVTALTLDVCDEADPTAIFFQIRAVQAVRFGGFL